jgi:transcription elongation GreA/GreB family factor
MRSLPVNRHPISRTEYDALEAALAKAQDRLHKALEDASHEMRGWSDIAAKAQYAASVEALDYQVARAKSRLNVVFPDDDAEQMRAYRQRENDRITSKVKDHAKVVGIGSRVVIELDGDEESYRIVSAIEARPSAGLLSNESPIGRALIGKRAGQRVRAETPAGIREFTILHVE